MNTSANAADVVASHSLVLAALFVWMTGFQTMFSRRLWPALTGEPAVRVSFATVLRTQALLGSTALVVLPLAGASVAGFPWAMAFYYSAAAFPYSAGDVTTRTVMRYASRQASTWTFACALELSLASVVAVVVFVNVFILLVAGPILLRTLTGQETSFSQNAQGMFNSTLLAASVMGTWLMVDPLLRALFVIRCFRIDAIRTGVDLKAALLVLLLVFVPVQAGVCGAGASPAADASSACAVLSECVSGWIGRAGRPPQARAPAPPESTPYIPGYWRAQVGNSRAGFQPANVQPISAQQLDRTIRQVTRRPEFVWRQPRVSKPGSDNAFLAFTEDAVGLVRTWVERVAGWLGEMVRAVLKWVLGDQSDEDLAGSGKGRASAWAGPLLYILCAIAAGAGIFLLLRVRLRRPGQSDTAAALEQQLIDLTKEDVTPDQAPEDEWLSMAARFLEAGDLKPATRALYLAVLAGLGRNGLITIHRAKSNLDYRRELARRARGNDEMLERFGGVVNTFERTWYGGHAISGEAFEGFRAAALAVRAHA